MGIFALQLMAFAGAQAKVLPLDGTVVSSKCMKAYRFEREL